MNDNVLTIQFPGTLGALLLAAAWLATAGAGAPGQPPSSRRAPACSRRRRRSRRLRSRTTPSSSRVDAGGRDRPAAATSASSSSATPASSSRLAIDQALGIYDLNATIDADGRRQQAAGGHHASRPRGIEASQDAQLRLHASALPSGGTFSVGCEQLPHRRTTARSRAFNPVYTLGPDLRLHPAAAAQLRPLATERDILVAQSNSQHQPPGVRAPGDRASLQQVINAYWNLVDAREQLGVAQESLGLANELHERNKIQVEVGHHGAARAGAERGRHRHPRGGDHPRPAGRRRRRGRAPPAPQPAGRRPLWADRRSCRPPIRRPRARRRSTSTRRSASPSPSAPELRSQEIQSSAGQARRRVLPRPAQAALDLARRLRLQRPRHTAATATPSARSPASTSAAGRRSSASPTPSRTAPPGRTSASANIDVDAARRRSTSSGQVIDTEVRQAARAGRHRGQVDRRRPQGRASSRSKNLDAEKKKYENGMSTSFQITQIQDQLTQARSGEVTATSTTAPPSPSTTGRSAGCSTAGGRPRRSRGGGRHPQPLSASAARRCRGRRR